MTDNEKENKVQKHENIDAQLFTDWVNSIYPDRYTVDITSPGTGHDINVINTTTARKSKIELKTLYTPYTNYTHWILNYGKLNKADIYWLRYSDDYTVVATNDQLIRFVEDYGDEAVIEHHQRKLEVDPDSPMITQVQLNVPHSEVDNYFYLYKGKKKVHNDQG